MRERGRLEEERVSVNCTFSKRRSIDEGGGRLIRGNLGNPGGAPVERRLTIQGKELKKSSSPKRGASWKEKRSFPSCTKGEMPTIKKKISIAFFRKSRRPKGKTEKKPSTRRRDLQYRHRKQRVAHAEIPPPKKTISSSSSSKGGPTKQDSGGGKSPEKIIITLKYGAQTKRKRGGTPLAKTTTHNYKCMRFPSMTDEGGKENIGGE